MAALRFQLREVQMLIKELRRDITTLQRELRKTPPRERRRVPRVPAPRKKAG
jgi:hypothetical protein